MIKIIFGLIIVVFIFFGVGGTREREKTVAKVGSHKVTMTEYMEAYNRRVNMYRNIFKEQFNDDLVRTLKLREVVMNNDIVDRYLLIQKSKEIGMTATDQELRERLENVDEFKKDGKFNEKVYLEVLKMNGLDQAKYKQSEKMAILSGKMTDLIKDNGAVLTDAQVWSTYVKEKGKIDLAYMVFDPSDYVNKAVVTDKEVDDLYEKEKNSHVSENRYRLKYITIIDKGPVKDDVAYMELLKAKDIERYGNEKGLAVTDMGMMTEKEVFQKLKNMKVNEWLKGLKKEDNISLPVRMDGRSYIFELVDFEAGKPVDKATVAKEIRERLSREKSGAMALAEAQKVVAGKSFTSNKDTGFLARNAAYIPAIGMIPKEDHTLMALSKGRESYEKPVEIGGKYYLFSLKDEKAPDKEEWEKDRDHFKRNLMGRNREAFFKSFMMDLRKSSKVKINWKEISVTENEE